MKRTIFSLLGLAALVAVPLTASAEPYGGYGGGAGASGVIASVTGGDVTLQNGRTIFLKSGTQIGPNGQTLQAGERISVRGYDAGNGNVNAQSIDILGYGGNAGRYGPGGPGHGPGRDGDRRWRRDHRGRHDHGPRGHDGDRRGDGDGN